MRGYRPRAAVTEKFRKIPNCSPVTRSHQTSSQRFCIEFTVFGNSNMKFVAALFVAFNSVLAFSPSTPAFKVNKKAPSSTSTLYGEFGASSTSFYTKTEKKESYESLEDVLERKCMDEKVREVIIDMLDVCAEITESLRSALVTVEGSMNDFGDAQLSVDVSFSLTSRDLLFCSCKMKCSHVPLLFP